MVLKGFFNEDEVRSDERPDGKVLSCPACGLYQNVLSPRMESTGKGELRILILGEAPGEVEDRKGQQWQGKTGRLLQRTCKQMGIDLFDDCANINSINCRPTDSKGANRKPTTHEINCCRQRVMKVIHEIRPKVIVPLGGSAITSLLGHRWKKRLDGISKWRGWTIPDRDLGAWVCPTFHPSFVERSEKFPEVELIWKQDLKRAFDMVDVPFPKWKDEKEYVHIVTPQEARREVRELLADDKEHWVCLDYETTGLKPHLPIHRIVCASLALSTTHSIVWMTPSVAQTQTILKPILTNPNVHVCAHNMKFEQMWTKEKLEFEITRLRWDSMLAAHVIDNRNGVTGLKFQTYVNFGVVDYDSAISSYLEGVTKSANSLNKVDQLIERFGPEMLMTYCGLDTIYGLKLTLKQREELQLARGEK